MLRACVLVVVEAVFKNLLEDRFQEPTTIFLLFIEHANKKSRMACNRLNGLGSILMLDKLDTSNLQHLLFVEQIQFELELERKQFMREVGNEVDDHVQGHHL
jgi:hypothetical protein